MKQDALIAVILLFLTVFLLPVHHGFAQSANEKTMFSVEAAQPIVLSGYTQVRFQSREDKTDNGFDIRRSRLSLKGKLGKRMTYKLQNDFGGTGHKLMDAELAYQVSGLLTVYAGQFTIPFSLENLASNLNLATINRSQVVEALSARGKDVLGNQNGRDIGMKLSGKYRLIEYSAGLFNGSGINTADVNEDKDVIGRLVLHPISSLGIGCSCYTGQMKLAGSTGSVNRNRIGAELSLTMSGISLNAEYIRGKDDVIEKDGWYVQAEYEILPDRLSGVLKYDVFNADLDRTDKTASVITAGCTVRLNDQSCIQFNYELKSEDVEVDNNAVIAQAQYAF